MRALPSIISVLALRIRRLNRVYLIITMGLTMVTMSVEVHSGIMFVPEERTVLKNAKADVHFQRGQELHQRGDYKGAIEAYREAIRIDPKAKDAYYSLGDAMHEKNGRTRDDNNFPVYGSEIDDAIAVYREVIQLWPTDGEAHKYLGEALVEKSDWDGALTAFAKAMQLGCKDCERAFWWSVDRVAANQRKQEDLNGAILAGERAYDSVAGLYLGFGAIHSGCSYRSLCSAHDYLYLYPDGTFQEGLMREGYDERARAYKTGYFTIHEGKVTFHYANGKKESVEREGNYLTFSGNSSVERQLNCNDLKLSGTYFIGSEAKITFTWDGQFVDQGIMTDLGLLSPAAHPAQGSYRIKHHTLTLQSLDGNISRILFYVLGKDTRFIQLGSAGLSNRKGPKLGY